MSDNLTVIIRSIGERTEQLCQKLILEQDVPEEQVITICVSPFTEALRKSFQIGMERGHKWTLCVDADVLLRPNSIADMIEEFENQPENVCEIQGYILDKFFGGPREGGIHIYRTSLLDKMLAHLPQYHAIRPESTTLKSMSSSGFPFMKIPYLVGLHDFEQYYRDIFRKCFVQAHKHLYVSELLLSLFRENMARDDDFKVALDGFVAGLYYNDEVRIDVKQDIYRTAFSKLQMEEKDSIPVNDYDLSTIETIIQNWTEPSVFRKYISYTIKNLEKDLEFEHAQMINEKRGIPRFFGKISRKLKESGPLKTLSYYIGLIFLNISGVFMRLSEKKNS